MSEICKCGHSKGDHELNDNGYCFGNFECTCLSFTARPDEPKGDKGNENAAVNNYAHKHYNDSSRMLGYVDGYKDAANEYNRQLQAERTRREDERQRMCRELIAIRRDESRHVAGNYYENWTAGRWRAVNEWVAKEFASELAQDSADTQISDLGQSENDT